MPGKETKIPSTDHIDDLLFFAASPSATALLFFVSTKAGLRAGEITKLTWDMVLGAGGEVGAVLELRDHAAKMGSGRLIPLHPDLQQALSALRQSSRGAGPVVCSERGGPMKPLSIVIWFQRAYEALGFDGCSSCPTCHKFCLFEFLAAQVALTPFGKKSVSRSTEDPMKSAILRAGSRTFPRFQISRFAAN